MRGKYSPTVTSAYMLDQQWHEKLLAAHGEYDKDGKPCEYSRYDVDGYDSYGYDKDDRDRAGNQEHEYYMGYETADGEYVDVNHLYEAALDAWTFDGVRPVSRKEA